MKKYLLIFITILIILLVGCNLVGTETPPGDPTNTPEITASPTMTQTRVPTETPEPTVTPFGTETLQLTPTQITPSTQVPTTPTPELGCVTIPCGPNHFFNPGFELPYAWRNPNQNQNIITAEFWNFEYLEGQSRRNPSETLNVPEAGDIYCPAWNYRCDGYQEGVNERAQRWFKSWGNSDSGVTQSLDLLEGHRYVIGAHVSTWSTTDAGITKEFSLLDNDDARNNIQWSIRANFNNGSVYDSSATVLGIFDYDDGIYDFNPNNGRYNSDINRTFVTPVEPDSNDIITINFGFTANNLYPFATIDHHIDNAYLYCLDCGFDSIPDITPEPTHEINLFPPGEPVSVIVVVDVLNVRVGASTDSPKYLINGQPRQLNKNDVAPVYMIYENNTTGEKWVRIVSTDQNGQWIALRHPNCPNTVCSVLK